MNLIDSGDRLININRCKKKIEQLKQELLYQERELIRLETGGDFCIHCLGTGQLVSDLNFNIIPHKYGKCSKCDGTGRNIKIVER